jgi:hypothetical protein
MRPNSPLSSLSSLGNMAAIPYLPASASPDTFAVVERPSAIPSHGPSAASEVEFRGMLRRRLRVLNLLYGIALSYLFIFPDLLRIELGHYHVYQAVGRGYWDCCHAIHWQPRRLALEASAPLARSPAHGRIHAAWMHHLLPRLLAIRGSHPAASASLVGSRIRGRAGTIHRLCQ